MNNEYQKAYEYVKNAQKRGLIQNYCCNIRTITGPTGATGPAISLEIGNVTIGDSISDVSIDDVGTGSEHVLNFVIPKGETGPQGATAP